MSKIRIITDSASDISVEDEKNYGIDIMCFSAAFGDKVYTSRIDYDTPTMYRMLEEYDGIPATSQLTAWQFMEKYEECLEDGCTDVILTTINSQGSATNGNAIMAREQFYEEHPEAKESMHIYIHDGCSYTGAYGQPVVEAAKMNCEGKSAEEIEAYLTDSLAKRRIYFGMFSLKYAGKSGRIPMAAAFIGEAIGLKPISRISDNKISTCGKARTEKKLYSEILKFTLADMDPGSPYSIVYGCLEEDADQMAKLMTEAVGYPPVSRYQIGTEVSVNAGPRVVGVIFDIKAELRKN